MQALRWWLERLAWALGGALLAMWVVRPHPPLKVKPLLQGRFHTNELFMERPWSGLVASQFHDPGEAKGRMSAGSLAASEQDRNERHAPASSPRLSIERMPGAVKLRGNATWDPETSTWTLIETYRAPARIDLVDNYYHQALVGAGYRVQNQRESTSESVFVGRRTGEHIQMTVRQIKGSIASSIQVIARIRP